MSSIASGGGTDLVVWLNEYHFFDSPVPESYVYLRTYEADGRPLQPAQIEIDGSHAQGAPSGALAVWNGSDYFVVFGRWYGRYGSGLPGPDVEAVRVTAAGHVIDGSRVSLIFEARPNGGTINALAWDGTHYLACVSTFVDPKLLLLDRDGQVVSSQDGLALSIAALPGGGFAMLRVVSGQVELVRVGSDGALSSQAILGPAGPGEAKIDVHGDRFAVVRHTSSGVVAEELDSDARVLVSVALPNDATIQSVVRRESSWVAAYDHPSGGCVVRFGSGVDPSTTCSPAARQPIVGVDRAAWIEKNVEVRTSGDLSLAGGDLASATVTSQSEAAAIATPSGSLVAWLEAGAIHIGGLSRNGSVAPSDPSTPRRNRIIRCWRRQANRTSWSMSTVMPSVSEPSARSASIWMGSRSRQRSRWVKERRLRSRATATNGWSFGSLRTTAACRSRYLPHA
ncbi:MAG: hypothetical protein WB973_18070 [Thermoanaerobaculia bacterium]